MRSTSAVIGAVSVTASGLLISGCDFSRETREQIAVLEGQLASVGEAQDELSTKVAAAELAYQRARDAHTQMLSQHQQAVNAGDDAIATALAPAVAQARETLLSTEATMQGLQRTLQEGEEARATLAGALEQLNELATSQDADESAIWDAGLSVANILAAVFGVGGPAAAVTAGIIAFRQKKNFQGLVAGVEAAQQESPEFAKMFKDEKVRAAYERARDLIATGRVDAAIDAARRKYAVKTARN